VKVQLGLRMAALAAVSTGVLSACGGAHPGAAAELDGYRIPMQVVDEQAAALCAVGPSVLLSGLAEGDQVDNQSFREIAARAQVQLRMAELAADELGLDVPTREVGIEELQVPTEDLDDAEEAGLLDFFEDTVRTRSLLSAVTERLSQDLGEGEDPNQATLDFLLSQVDDVSIDPRLGIDENLESAASSGSLSVAVSDAAELPDGAEDPAGLQTALDDLPASQTCG
jgi:hypothetical protein